MSTSIAMRALAAVILCAAAFGCETMGMPSAQAQPASRCAATDFNIYFDEWQAELNEDARDTIAVVQRELSGCTIEHVRIVGLAGARGDEGANLDISWARAEAIAAALEQGGWPASRFEVIARGEEGATAGDVVAPMRRRAHVVVRASAAATS